MEISDNWPIITNGYPISEWVPGVPIRDDDEDENVIFDAMEQVAYDVHVYSNENMTNAMKMMKVTVIMTDIISMIRKK